MDILIIEDERNMAVLLRRCLQDLHAHLHFAETLGQGISKMEQIHFDVVCLDLGLPDSESRSTLARVAEFKTKYPKTAFMIVTGNPVLTETEAIKAGADGFIRKDDAMRAGKLIQVISEVFGRVTSGSSGKKLDNLLLLAQKATTNTVKELNQENP